MLFFSSFFLIFLLISPPSFFSSPSFGAVLFGSNHGSDLITFSWDPTISTYCTTYNALYLESSSGVVTQYVANATYNATVSFSSDNVYVWFVYTSCVYYGYTYQCWEGSASNTEYCNNSLTYCHMQSTPSKKQQKPKIKHQK